MKTNPYESPTTSSSAAPDARSGQLPRVEGNALVVPSGTVLPAICVRTNQPVSENDLIRKDFYRCSPLVGLLILLSGCLLIFAYFVVRKKCTLTYGLHPSLRKKYRNRSIIKAIAAVVLFFALPFSAATDSTPVIITVFVLFVVSIVALFIGNAPLSVIKHRRAMFWIKGCSNEFLTNIKFDTGS